MSRALFLVVLLLAPALMAQPAANLPTVEQLRQQLDSNPQEVLRGVARLLALKGPAAQAYDRYELFMLRGEASLRTKALPAAAEAFANAANETDDAKKQAEAKANEILARRSRHAGYLVARPSTQPGGAKAGETVPIIQPEDRKAAMNALLADALVMLAPRVKAATSANNLNPIIDVARTLGELNAVEVTATGGNEQTKNIGQALGAHSHTLIRAALDKMKARTEEIWRQGSRVQTNVDRFGNRIDQYGMLGLTSIETNELKSILATAEKVVPVAGDLATVTGSAELTADAADAKALRERAREVLEYDYANAGRYTRQPGQGEGTTPGQPPRQGTTPPRQGTNPPRTGTR